MENKCKHATPKTEIIELSRFKFPEAARKHETTIIGKIEAKVNPPLVIAIPLIGILFSKRQWMFSKKFGFVTPGEMIGSYFKSDILRVLVVVVTVGFAIPFIAVQLYLGGLLISTICYIQIN